MNVKGYWEATPRTMEVNIFKKISINNHNDVNHPSKKGMGRIANQGVALLFGSEKASQIRLREQKGVKKKGGGDHCAIC